MNGRKLMSMGWAVLIAAILWAVPVSAAEKDTGYPWFADTMENNQTIMKPATIFGVHPRTAEGDTGYPWFTDIMENSQTILQPGTMTNCHDDFTVENMGKEVAEVRIIRGDVDNHDISQIPAGGKLGYTLQYPTGGSGGNWVDEARIVNSTAGDSKLKVHCK